MEFEEIYSVQMVDAIKEGKQVYALDRKTKEVLYINGITVFELCEILKSTEKDRYEFWIEKEIERE